MSIAAGIKRAGRSTRRGSTRPGVLGRIGGAVKGLRGRAGAMKHRRSRGITGRELRGFNKVARLLAKFGMVPKKLGRRGARVTRRTD